MQAAATSVPWLLVRSSTPVVLCLARVLRIRVERTSSGKTTLVDAVNVSHMHDERVSLRLQLLCAAPQATSEAPAAFRLEDGGDARHVIVPGYMVQLACSTHQTPSLYPQISCGPLENICGRTFRWRDTTMTGTMVCQRVRLQQPASMLFRQARLHGLPFRKGSLLSPRPRSSSMLSLLHAAMQAARCSVNGKRFVSTSPATCCT